MEPREIMVGILALFKVSYHNGYVAPSGADNTLSIISMNTQFFQS